MRAAQSLATLSPELFPIIASHLPLYAQPSTLIALALTDRRLNEIVIPRLLYQKVSLKGERRTLEVLRSFRSDISRINKGGVLQGENVRFVPITHYIRRLSISSELSKEARENNVDTLSKLRGLIDIGGLPNLLSLDIHMDNGWYVDDDYDLVAGFGRPDRSFWASLKEKCPKVKEISLTGLVDYDGDSWFEGSGFYEYQGLGSFRLDYMRRCVDEDEPTGASRTERLLDTLSTSSPLLHTLDLSFEHADFIDATARNGLFTRRFPHLRVLILEHFIVQNIDVVSDFWSSHPLLERVELCRNFGGWFDGVPPGVLPRLKILKATFSDVRTLLPILKDQLTNLTITSSINNQVPYLLRSVLPNGLASLRSLGIHQRASRHSREVFWEGGRWHENENGSIGEVSKRKAARPFNAAHLLSLARGAPNLEELELNGEAGPPFETIALALANFANLRRLYLLEARDDTYDSFIPFENELTFLEIVHMFAQECKALESVIGIAKGSKTVHLAAKIHRNTGEHLMIRRESGFGRVIGIKEEDYLGFI